MKVKIICVGSVRERFYQDAINEYLKRCSRFTDIEIVELKEYKSSNEKKDRDKIIANETASIVEYLNKEIKDKSGVCNILLDIKGDSIDSIKFSEILKNPDIKYLNFIVGGSFGLSDHINSHKKISISFSKMTFPHQLMRIILLEQIFRGYKIALNEDYHK